MNPPEPSRNRPEPSRNRPEPSRTDHELSRTDQILTRTEPSRPRTRNKFFTVLKFIGQFSNNADISRGVGWKGRTTFNFSLRRISRFLHHPIKLHELSEYSAPRGTSASWKFAFISRGLRIGRIFAYGRISTLNNSIKKKRKKARIVWHIIWCFFMKSSAHSYFTVWVSEGSLNGK